MERSKSPATAANTSRKDSPDRASADSDALVPEPLSPLAARTSSPFSPVRVVLPQLSSSSPHRANLLRTPSKASSSRVLDYGNDNNNNNNLSLSSTPKMEGSESIKVIIRIRPTINLIENGEKGMRWTTRAINVTWDNSEKSLKHAILQQLKKKEFFFDRVYDPESKQRDIYDDHCHAMVMKCMSGFNATIFAYGQTSSGKTHTMMGPPSGGAAVALEDEGVIPRCGLSVFAHVASCHNHLPRTQQFNVLVSYLEIYNEKVYDLLGHQATKVLKDKVTLEINEHPVSGFFVAGLSKHAVTSGEEVQTLIREGSKNRCVSSTKMNDLSSRSHSVLTFWIHKSSLEHDLPTTAISSQLNLVDLAGSEKYDINLTPQSKMQQGKETTNINQSLSCLANVISALSAGADVTQTPESKTPPRHVPYRDSKLTLLLKSSLGGNASTLMIACLNPAFTNIVESVSTLRYAHRAKLVKNRPTLNTDPKDALIHRIRLLSAELAEVQEQLRLQSSLPARLVKLVRKTYVKVRESTRTLGFSLNEDIWTAEAGEIEEEEKQVESSSVARVRRGDEKETMTKPVYEKRKSKLKRNDRKEEDEDSSNRSIKNSSSNNKNDDIDGSRKIELKRNISQETTTEDEEGEDEEKKRGKRGEETTIAEREEEEEERSEEEGEPQEEEVLEGNEVEFRAVKWDTERLVRLHDLLKNNDRSLLRQTSGGKNLVPPSPTYDRSSPTHSSTVPATLSVSSSPLASSLYSCSPASAAAAIAFLSAPTPTVASSSSLVPSPHIVTNAATTNAATTNAVAANAAAANAAATNAAATNAAATTSLTTTITISTATTPLSSSTSITATTTTSVLSPTLSPYPSPSPFTLSVGTWGEIEKPVTEFLQIAHHELNSISQIVTELDNKPLAAVSPALQEEWKAEEKKYTLLCEQVKEAQIEVEGMGTGMGVALSPKKNPDADYRAFYEIATLRSDRMLSLRVAKQRMAQQKDRLDMMQAEIKTKQIIEENEQVARTSHARLVQRQQALLRMEEQLWSTVAARKPDSSLSFVITPASSSSSSSPSSPIPSSASSSLRRALSPSPRSPLSFTLSLPSPFPISSLTLPSHLSQNSSSSSSSSAETQNGSSPQEQQDSRSSVIEEENESLRKQLEDMTTTLEELRRAQRNSVSEASLSTSSSLSTSAPSSTASSTSSSAAFPTAPFSSSSSSCPSSTIASSSSSSSTSSTSTESRASRETREGSRRHGVEALSSFKFRPEKETKNLVRLAELQESLARVAAASSSSAPKTPSIPPPPPRRRRPPPPPPESVLSPSAPVSLLPALLYSAILRMSLASEYRVFEAERYAHFLEEAKQRDSERDAQMHDLQEDLRHTRQAKTELAIYSAAALAETKDMLTKLEEQVEYLTQKQQEASRPRSSMSLSRSRR